MTEQQLRDEMVQIGASLFNRGYATGSAGNLSLLLPDGNLLATPTGSCLGELQAQRRCSRSCPAAPRTARLHQGAGSICVSWASPLTDS